ncbi:NAD(P)-dependent alcohol dehydrogenase [Cesiribacter sp. SM1]|uniref:NAD(P)-dependent alcohol dehydrogenase n=1 Tax=Cesiribacter sp. SM1 TaxID=2861196 RepID=UPI001CD22477|nr:NAD(P)-dependent alcohol dehydrogenase [Cesiribacter sp. SM1]
MKAIVYTKYGMPDVLKLKEVPKPTPRNGEVLVKVHAASVNSWDWDLLRGKPFLTRLGGILSPKHNILGADVAGQIEAVGPNVEQFKPGDAVFGDLSGCSWGGFAEYVCAPEHAFALKSAGMSWEEAAAIPQAATLALQGLHYKGQIRKGQTVLINGAGGGVGTFAIQMAKSWGAEVTGVDSTGKLELLRAIGADHVIDYTKENFTDKGQRYDFILDVVGNRSLYDHKRALNPGGTYVMIGGSTNRIVQLLFMRAWISRADKQLAGQGHSKMGLLMHKPNTSDLDIIKALFEAGKVVPVIDRRYPLQAVPEAIRCLGEGQALGKLVITL